MEDESIAFIPIGSIPTEKKRTAAGTKSVTKRKRSADRNRKGDDGSLDDTTSIPSSEKKTLKLVPRINWLINKYIIGKAKKKYQSLSPRWRLMTLAAFILWKVTTFLLLLYFVTGTATGTTSTISSDTIVDVKKERPLPLRILHIVTTLAEYGRRGNKGPDRLVEILIPVLRTSVESMLNISNCDVDVYLILGYTLKPERKQLVLDALPDGVGLEIWDDATPITYDGGNKNVIRPITRALARQHRYVLSDKLYNYDFFTVFEDDMLITRHHVENFIQMSRDIDQLIAQAPPDAPRDASIAGTLNRRQAEMLIPGYVRVEVLKPGSKSQEDKDIGPIEPINLEQISNNLDPSVCCQIPCSSIFDNPKKVKSCYENYPSDPTSHQLMIWETAIKGFSVRQLPSSSNSNLNWVALQPGPRRYNPGATLGYWSGQDGVFQEQKQPPGEMEPQLFGQQGGFMASRDQILRFERICPGRFLPPFDLPHFRDDGLFMNNVEFWSGGYQLFGGGDNGGCHMQRILSLDPHVFSKQLLYHVSNNKQESINRQRRVKVVHLLGQLHSVREKAKNVLRIRGQLVT